MSTGNGIKKIPAGPAYKPSAERMQRDTLKAFLSRPKDVEQQLDKLFKVLTPGDIAAGFPKTDIYEFVVYLQENCNLHKTLLDESSLKQMEKPAGIIEIKNGKK